MEKTAGEYFGQILEMDLKASNFRKTKENENVELKLSLKKEIEKIRSSVDKADEKAAVLKKKSLEEAESQAKEIIDITSQKIKFIDDRFQSASLQLADEILIQLLELER